MEHTLITRGNISNQVLKGKVAIVTGAGGGIGFEAARALVHLGAKCVIAEINRNSGKEAAKKINKEIDAESAWFFHADVGSERSVNKLSRQVLRKFGRVDIIINNATISPMGAIKDCVIKDWDASYRVNLRGPVLLARAFLPGMLERDQGVIICVSSAGGKFMGAYEIIKSAQVELAQTLDAELEETNVMAFTIAPGIVPETPGAKAGIEAVSSLYGMTTHDFIEISKNQRISAEAAGTGFAVSTVFAEQFRGLEIGVITALNAAGIDLDIKNDKEDGLSIEEAIFPRVIEFLNEIVKTFEARQIEWNNMALFQKQWMKRDFKNFSGMSFEQMDSSLRALQFSIEQHQFEDIVKSDLPLERLSSYYQHYLELAKGYIKDKQLLEEQVGLLKSWINQIEDLRKLLE